MKYDLEKRKYLENPTIGDLVHQLELENQNSQISICGDSNLYIHVNEDNTILCIDTERLDDSYLDNYPEELVNGPINKVNNNDYHIPRFRALELITTMIDSYYGNEDEDIIIDDLRSKGFSDLELIELGYSINYKQNIDNKKINIDSRF